MQDKGFLPLIWQLNMCICLKFVYEVPHQIAQNQTKRSQTKACITKSWEISPLLRYYKVSGQPICPSFKGQGIQKTDTAQQ
jgi:hypothetical protein